MTTSIRVEGLEELQRKLGALAANTALVPEMGRSLERVRAPLVKYPLPPPNSRYKRTGKLGQRWTSQVNTSSTSLEGIIGNNVVYARWVQDKEKQAKIHQGRWPTIQDVLQDKMQAIIAGFEKEIARLLK